METNNFYSAKEICQILGVSPSTIFQWEKKELIKYKLNDKNKKVFDINSVPEKYKLKNVSTTPTPSTPTPVQNSNIQNKNVNNINVKNAPLTTIQNNNTKTSVINADDSDCDDDNDSYEEFTKSLDPETAEKVRKDKEKFEILLSVIDKIVVNHFSNDCSKSVDVSDTVRKFADKDSLMKLDKLSDLFMAKERENENNFHKYLFKQILPKLNDDEKENILNFIRNKKLYKAYISFSEKFMKLIVKEIKLAMVKEEEISNEEQKK
jgi:uncharacterized protein (UPF0179 family)